MYNSFHCFKRKISNFLIIVYETLNRRITGHNKRRYRGCLKCTKKDSADYS